MQVGTHPVQLDNYSEHTMKPLQFVLLTIATAIHCCPRARASEGAPAAATAAATAPPCPTGYRAGSKVGLSVEQPLLW